MLEPSISVVVPANNEERTIREVLLALHPAAERNVLATLAALRDELDKFWSRALDGYQDVIEEETGEES